MTERMRYVQVGLGGRHVMYRDAAARGFAESSELLGICDNNAGRLKLAIDAEREHGNEETVAYDAADFDRMIADCKPDRVIVTTKDCHHDDYICRAMDLGCDVITEKPMTIDAEKCQRIIDTQKRTGKQCMVTFNYRYAPPRTQVKDLLMSGVIGNVLSVDFHWMLDTSHGADYFRRWHRNKENSGGLMVHKATHHFDLVNWWLSTVPEMVTAEGHRMFYTPETAGRYGLANRAERCHECPEIEKCPFAMKMSENEGLKSLYLDCEQYDGYHRDRCVFSDSIDIEDTMNVLVSYANGVKMSYSLNAFCAWEGYVVCFNGTQGRLEHKCEETAYINADGSVPGALKSEGTWTRVYPHWKPAYEVELWSGSGGHGGADPVMLDYIFEPDKQEADKYLRAADQRSGAYSILTGIAANHSMANGRPFRIDALVTGLEVPEYPDMPDGSKPLPLKEEK